MILFFCICFVIELYFTFFGAGEIIVFITFVCALQCIDNNDTDGNSNDINNRGNKNYVGTTDPQRDDVIVVIVDTAVTSKGCVPAVRAANEMTADALATDVRRGDDRHDGDCLGQHHQQDQLAVDHATGDVKSGDPLRLEQSHPDTAVLQPHTACFDTGNNRQLHDLTASTK